MLSTKSMFQITQASSQWWLDVWPQLTSTHSFESQQQVKKCSPKIYKENCYFSLSGKQNATNIKFFICFDFKWLRVLIKTIVIQNNHYVPHYPYKVALWLPFNSLRLSDAYMRQ